MKCYKFRIILFLLVFTLSGCDNIKISPIDRNELRRTNKEKTKEEVLEEEKTIGETVLNETTLDDKISDEKTSDETTPNETTSDEKTPNEKTSDEKTLNETTSDETTSDEKTQNEVTPNEKTSNEKTPNETPSNENTSNETPPKINTDTTKPLKTEPLYATVPLNLREGPGTSYKIVGALNKGDEITVLGKKNNWYEITLGEGTAYVHSKYFTKDRSSVVTPEGKYDVEPDYKTYVGQVFKLVNEYRVENGLEKFKLDSRLNEVAKLRAKEIEILFSHERPDGRNCLTAFADTRHTDFTSCGENIAYGYTSAQDVFQAWVDSEPHRENILNPTFKRIGMAVWKDTYISQEFSD